MARITSAMIMISMLIISACNRIDVSTNEHLHRQGLQLQQQKNSDNNVWITIVSQSDTSLTLKLVNNTNRKIYIAYQPSDEKGKAKFLSNYLEMKESNDNTFTAVDPMPHYVPTLHPIDPGDSMFFSPFFMPEVEGEYRVRVSYIDEEEIYQLIINKLPFEWSEEQQSRVQKAWRSIHSDIFTIKNK